MPVANDDWADATNLTSGCVNEQVDPGGSDNPALTCGVEGAEPTPAALGAPPDHTVWFKWTAPASPPLVTSVKFLGLAFWTGPSDAALGVYTGASLAGLVEVGSDATSLFEYVEVVVASPTPGETYYLQLCLSDTGEQFTAYGCTSELVFDYGDEGFQVEVYDGDNPWDGGGLVGILSDDAARTVLRSKNDQGSFGVGVPRGSTDAGLLVEGRWLKFRLDGQVIMSGRIAPRRQNTIDEGEESAETKVIQGPGEAAALADGIVVPHPATDLLRSPGDTLWFNFAHPEYPDWEDSPWVPAFELFEQGDPTSPYTDELPEDWPDPGAFWIWGEAAGVFGFDDPLQTVGFCYFVTEVNIVDEGDYSFFFTADDGCELYVQGVLQASRTEAFMWRQTQRVDLHLEPGVLRVAAKVENITRASTATNGAGFLFAMYSTTQGGELDTLILHSDSTWQCLPFPADPPGFTPGEILAALFSAAGDRDIFYVSWYDFTEEDDSGGNAWTGEVELGVAYGASVLDVVRQLAGSAIDWDFNYDDHVLLAYNKGGLDTGGAVTFTEGVHFASLDHSAEPRYVTDLLVHLADGTYKYVSSGQGSYSGADPKKEALLEAGSAPSPQASDKMAEGEFERLADSKVAISAEVFSIAAAVPFVDYWPGKVVTATDEAGAGTSTELTSVLVAELNPPADGKVGGTQIFTVEGLQDA